MTFLESPYEVSSPSMSESANRSLGSTSQQHSASRTSSLAGAAFPDRQTIHGHTGPFISRNEILENSEPDRHSWRNPAIAVADQATASPNLPRALAPWHEESALDACQDPYYAWVDTGSPSPRSKAYLQSCMPTVTQSSKEGRQENFAVMSQDHSESESIELDDEPRYAERQVIIDPSTDVQPAQPGPLMEIDNARSQLLGVLENCYSSPKNLNDRLSMAMKISSELRKLYEALAKPLSSGQKVSPKELDKVVNKILKGKDQDEEKMMGIARAVDSLYGQYGWRLRENVDSGFGGTNSTTQFSGVVSKEETNSTSILQPPNKRQKTGRASIPQAAQSVSQDTAHNSPCSTISKAEHYCHEPNCGSRFGCAEALKTHWKSKKHFPSTSSYCFIIDKNGKACGYSTSRPDNIPRHWEKRMHKCNVSKRAIGKTRRDKVMKLRDDYTFRIEYPQYHDVCPYCPETFLKAEESFSHISRNHASKEVEPYNHRCKSEHGIAVNFDDDFEKKIERKKAEGKKRVLFDGIENLWVYGDDNDSVVYEHPDDDENSGDDEHSDDQHSDDGHDHPGREPRPNNNQSGARNNKKRGRMTDSSSAGKHYGAGPSDSGGGSNTHQAHFNEASDCTPSVNPSDISHVKELGRGRYGTVDAVLYKSTKETYARKVIPLPKHAFSSEISILNRLQHPHIIKFIGSYASKTLLSLFLWPVAKSDLAVYLRQSSVELEKRSFTPKQSVLPNWFGDLASALHYLHNNGIIHGDIKPKNILVSFDNVIYLSDFGSARYTEDTPKAERNQVLGWTPRYCAPEVSNSTIASYRWSPMADVFSLGCVFVEMNTVLAGRSLQAFEHFGFPTSNDATNTAFNSIIPKVHIWTDSLSTPEFTYSYDFSQTIKDMLRFIPKQRPTTKDLVPRLRLPNPATWDTDSVSHSEFSSPLDNLLWIPCAHQEDHIRMCRFQGETRQAIEFSKTVDVWNKGSKGVDIVFNGQDHKAQHSLFAEWSATSYSQMNKTLASFEQNDLKSNCTTFVLRASYEGMESSHESEITLIFSATSAFTRSLTYNSWESPPYMSSLEEYFANTEPPSSSEDILALWTGLFGLLNAVVSMHENVSDAPLICYHFDLKPSNILVFGEKSGCPYLRTFGFANHDVSHIQDTQRGWEGYNAHNISYDLHHQNSVTKHYLSGSVNSTGYDLWTLGCIFSEVAIWMAMGRSGLKAQRQHLTWEYEGAFDSMDLQQTSPSNNCLETVSIKSTENFIDDVANLLDPITNLVCEELIAEMLDPPSSRSSLENLQVVANGVIQQTFQSYSKAITRTMKPSNKFIRTVSEESISCSTSIRSRSRSIESSHRIKRTNKYQDSFDLTLTRAEHETETSTSQRESLQPPISEHKIERFIREERDFRSYTIKEYDKYQEDAKRLHHELLEESVYQILVTLYTEYRTGTEKTEKHSGI